MTTMSTTRSGSATPTRSTGGKASEATEIIEIDVDPIQQRDGKRKRRIIQSSSDEGDSSQEQPVTTEETSSTRPTECEEQPGERQSARP